MPATEDGSCRNPEGRCVDHQAGCRGSGGCRRPARDRNTGWRRIWRVGAPDGGHAVTGGYCGAFDRCVPPACCGGSTCRPPTCSSTGYWPLAWACSASSNATCRSALKCCDGCPDMRTRLSPRLRPPPAVTPDRRRRPGRKSRQGPRRRPERSRGKRWHSRLGPRARQGQNRPLQRIR
jgi:hypothetical protein